ncbi:helix-turn-helix domain-containing protein [Methylovulum psychrotolerans]|jgi:hypothetical protein|uniref:XRE family transcriptional regulator n=1 Tax=Methylovulum psychrotolerans TaxID=1704499 RepID=A0A1Z4C4R5_9GAMM|nr:hypothetical protein [Methylovulum psychrotolerans]ASF48531.1 hypothetical protein CEK71_22105 [Methylovulum psychrotolerans]MBT9096455.1 hypothetical protein [Methylovulum psychrotolerans]
MIEIVDNKLVIQVPQEVDKSQGAQTFGGRMKAARELNNYSLSEAYPLFGYSNASMLSKIENASNGLSVPIWLVVRASEVYFVSTDFLFGVSEDWERDAQVSQEREVTRMLSDCLLQMRAAELNQVRTISHKIDACGKATHFALTAITKIYNALETVRRKNAIFDEEIIGGAALVKATDEAFALAAQAKTGLAKAKFMLRGEAAR